MVFEEVLFHIIDGFIRMTGSDRLVLTGGAALNAAANMRVLEHFDAGYYRSRPQAIDAASFVGSACAGRRRGNGRSSLRIRRRRRGARWADARARFLLRARLAHVRYHCPP